MSLFEYVAVMMSVVLALGVARILSFLGTLAGGTSRFRLSPLHLVWVLLMFATLLLAWHTIWSFRDQPTFPIGQIVMMLIATSLIFIGVRILIPDEPEDRMLDLESHYAAVRVPFFSVMSLLWIFPLTGIAIFQTFEPASPRVLCRVAWLGLAATGLLVRHVWVHWTIAGAWTVVLIAYFGLVSAEFSASNYPD